MGGSTETREEEALSKAGDDMDYGQEQMNMVKGRKLLDFLLMFCMCSEMCVTLKCMI